MVNVQPCSEIGWVKFTIHLSTIKVILRLQCNKRESMQGSLPLSQWMAKITCLHEPPPVFLGHFVPVNDHIHVLGIHWINEAQQSQHHPFEKQILCHAKVMYPL